MRPLRTLLAATPLLLLAAALVAAQPTTDTANDASAADYDTNTVMTGSEADIEEEDTASPDLYTTMPVPDDSARPPYTKPTVPEGKPGSDNNKSDGQVPSEGETGGNTPNNGNVGSSDRTVTAYWTDWTAQDMPPEKIPYTKITHINYAFATLEQDYSLKIGNEQYVPQVIKPAHENNVKVLLAVGGWSGSGWFSPMVGSAQARTVFIGNCKAVMDKHKFDGIDLDWEFPGEVGMEGNKADPVKDAPGLEKLVIEMRAEFTKTYGQGKKEITLAGSLYPFNVKVGSRTGWMTNARKMADAVDRINLMTYEMTGPWSPTTGPNAAFRHDPNGKLPVLSVANSVGAWRSIGVPANKLTVGLANFGRSARATEDMSAKPSQYAKFDKQMPQGDQADTGEQKNGIWQWRNLRSQGILLEPGKAAPGWKHYWDTVTRTPWLYNPETKIFISYDDPRSLAIKSNFARCQGLNGVMIWSVSQDNGELLDATNQAIHATAACPAEFLRP